MSLLILNSLSCTGVQFPLPIVGIPYVEAATYTNVINSLANNFIDSNFDTNLLKIIYQDHSIHEFLEKTVKSLNSPGKILNFKRSLTAFNSANGLFLSINPGYKFFSHLGILVIGQRSLVLVKNDFNIANILVPKTEFFFTHLPEAIQFKIYKPLTTMNLINKHVSESIINIKNQLADPLLIDPVIINKLNSELKNYGRLEKVFDSSLESLSTLSVKVSKSIDNEILRQITYCDINLFPPQLLDSQNLLVCDVLMSA